MKYISISNTMAAGPKVSLLVVTAHSVINANSDHNYDAFTQLTS